MSEDESRQKIDETAAPQEQSAGQTDTAAQDTAATCEAPAEENQAAQEATTEPQEAQSDEPKWEEPSQPQANVVDYEKKAAEMEDKYLRCHAEFDNYRKRMAREFNEARDQARRNTVTDFLTVYDYFAMGMASIDSAPNLDILKQGMTMIWAEFQKTLDSLGVKALDSVGKAFDAKLHDAVSQEASDTVPEGIVLREWKKAFMLGDKLLRPAVVVVSSGPAAATGTAEAVPEEAAEQQADGNTAENN